MWVATAVIEEGKSRSAAANRLWRPIEQDIETHISDPLADVRDEFQEILDVDDDTARIMKSTVFQDYFDSMLRNNWPVEDTVWKHFHDTVSEEIARRAVGEHGETTPIASRYTPEEFGQLIGDAPDEVIYNALRSGVEEVFSIAHAQVVTEEIEMEVNTVIVETQEFFDKRAATQEAIHTPKFIDQEDAEHIGQAVMERASETACFGCVVEETINEMLEFGDLVFHDDDHVALVQAKVMDSMRGDFCGQHSALNKFGDYSAEIVLREMSQNGWEGAHGHCDQAEFTELFSDMPDHVFDYCFKEVMKRVVSDAEALVFMDMESD